MKTQGKVTIAVCLLLALSAFGQPFGPERTAGAAEKTITSKRTRTVAITLANDSGKLTAGENRFCVLFYNLETANSADVQNVRVDFRQQVGRIQERPIAAELTPVQ